MKIMFGCGVFCMFRGREHVSFVITQVKFGNYPRSFAHAALAGFPYVAIANLLDKTHRLTVNNSYARDTTDFLRFPINEDDPSDFGGSLKRFVQKLGPGQVRMYCRPASEEYINSNYRRHGNMTSVFYANSPLGLNKIKELMAMGAAILGISKNFRAHSLRAVGVTKLANDSSISDAERCRAARHSSVSANKAYQVTDGISEANRLRALGITLPTVRPVELQEELRTAGPEHVEVVSLRALQDDVTKTSSKTSSSVPPMSQGEESEEIEYVDISKNSAENSVCSDMSEIVLKVHEKDHKKQNMTQDQLDELREEFSSLKGLIKGVQKDPIPPPREEAAPMTLTQVGINDLKSEIGELQGLVRKQQEEDDRKPAALSPNQLAIKMLREEVKNLRNSLEEKQLYCDSLEHDMFTRSSTNSPSRSEFQKATRRIRELERENKELLYYISRDEDREHRRMYNRY